MARDLADDKLFVNAPIGIARIGTDGSWLEVNQRLSDILGYSADELERLRFQDITHPDDLDKDLAHMNRLLAQKHGSYNLSKRYIRRDGSSVWTDLNVMLLHQEQTGDAHFISVIQDISAMKSKIEKLEHETRTDPLTKLRNRAGFHEAAQDAYLAYQRRGTPFALAFIDLDGFKQINDTLGHMTGDRLPRSVARRLQRTAGSDGVAARLGGDELAVLLPGIASAAGMRQAYNGLNNALADPFIVRQQKVAITASIGLAHCPNDAKSVRALMECADKAMYASKNRIFST